MNDNIICIIQARMDSSRLPAKVVAPIAGNPLLYYVIRRATMSRLRKFVVATTKLPVDDIIQYISKKCGVDCVRGDEFDVLSRFVQVAELYNAKAVIRITADCPLIDPDVIDKVIDLYSKNFDLDYIFIEGYPRGLGDVELISNSALKNSYKHTKKTETYYREHVMTYILNNPDKFKINIVKTTNNTYKNYRLCVDELDDLKVIRAVYEYFLPRLDFKTESVLRFLTDHPDIPKINQHVKQKTM